jgi:hypothetical protein
MTKAKCSEPTIAMVKLGDSDWTPACQKHLDTARSKSAKAGKKALAKGLTKAQAAQARGVNADDKLPVHARALTETEREMAPPCLASSLGG